LLFCSRFILIFSISREDPAAMDYLWTPWRYQYIAQVHSGSQPECIFCDAAARKDDHVTLVAHRGTSCFVILNRYPYTSGHVMVVPYAHVAELRLCEPAALTEMMHLAQRVEAVLRDLYKPDGMNLGMNLGRAAGAGVVGHLHLHALPRWVGDSNFMTVTGETRVHPEDLSITYEKLRKALA
jgi:Diadenosine tetraphosphate (Ap4A) hydrolase and other HIT family hydrolases